MGEWSQQFSDALELRARALTRKVVVSRAWMEGILVFAVSLHFLLDLIAPATWVLGILEVRFYWLIVALVAPSVLFGRVIMWVLVGLISVIFFWLPVQICYDRCSLVLAFRLVTWHMGKKGLAEFMQSKTFVNWAVVNLHVRNEVSLRQLLALKEGMHEDN